jgi:hypothetical protein
MREETRSPEARAAPLFFHIPKSTSAPDDRLAPSISYARLVRKRSCDRSMQGRYASKAPDASDPCPACVDPDPGEAVHRS